jgi:hypothetical protein
MALIVPNLCVSQTIKPGSFRHLINENGFSQIILGADLSSVPADKLSYLDDNNELDQYRDSSSLKSTLIL